MSQRPPRPAPLYVFAPRTTCPHCDSTDVISYRSTAHADEAVSRHMRCRACRGKFVLVLEPGVGLHDLEEGQPPLGKVAGMGTETLQSVGFLAGTYGVAVEAIRETFARLGVRPVTKINGIGYYDADQVAQLLRELDRTRGTSGR